MTWWQALIAAGAVPGSGGKADAAKTRPRDRLQNARPVACCAGGCPAKLTCAKSGAVSTAIRTCALSTARVATWS